MSVRATDLLGSVVEDTRGRRLGKVHDIRLARASAAEPWRIDAVVVGPSALSYRFGYAQHEVNGPYLVTAVATLLNRRSRRISWTDVLSFDERRLTVRTAPTGDAS